MVKRIKCTVLRSVPLAGARWSGTGPAGPANASIVKVIPSTGTSLGKSRHTAFVNTTADRDGSPDNCPASPYEKPYEIPRGLFLDVLA